jgi:uncharacterized membrane protein
VEAVEIKILITPDDFQNYNTRLPNSSGELDSFAEKVQCFIEQAMKRESRKMFTSIGRSPVTLK